MVSEQFKQNIKQYGREIDAKLVFDDFELDGTDIVKVEKIFDADFMTTTMQEVNGELIGRYDLTDKAFSLYLGVKPKLETTNQIDSQFSGLRRVGDDLVQTMVVEPGKIYNFQLDILNLSHLPMTIAGQPIEAGEMGYVEDTVVAGPDQTTYDLIVSGESLHFVAYGPQFELDNRFLEHEYIDLGRFNVVEHERKVDAEGDDTTTFKAFDHMIRTHDTYDAQAMQINYPITMELLINSIARRSGLIATTAGVNLRNTIPSDKWSEREEVTYRNILDEIAEATGAGFVVFNNRLIMKPFDAQPVGEINEDDVFSLSLKQRFGAVNVLSFKDAETKAENHYPSHWQTIPNDQQVEITIEDNQIVKGTTAQYAPSLLPKLANLSYYPFEAETQGFGYLRPLDVVEVVDLNNKKHKSVIMHSTLKIGTDVKETFKALPPVLHKVDSKVIKPEDRKLNRVIGKGSEGTNPMSISTFSMMTPQMELTNLTAKIQKLEERINELERG